MYTVEVPKYGTDIYAWNKPTSSSIQEYRGRLTASPNTPGIMSRLLGADIAGSDLSWFSGLCPGKTSDLVMDSKGATAISIVKPTNPAVDIATSLAELYRDGTPSMPGFSRTPGGHGPLGTEGRTGLGNIGSEYLNLKFGWSPTIHDGRDFIKAIRHYDSILDQYLRDAGKLIHRSYDFSPEVTSTKVVTTNTAPGYWGGIGPTGNWETRDDDKGERTKQKIAIKMDIRDHDRKKPRKKRKRG